MQVLNKYKDDVEEAVYGGRGSPFGNPFASGTREENIERFRNYFFIRIKNESDFKEEVLSLKNKRVWCFCKPKPCHLDVVKEWLELQ